MKVVIVTSMLPSSIQSYIYTSMDGEIAYDAFIAKIRAVVGNKVAMMAKPTPMDIGYAATDDGREEARRTFMLFQPGSGGAEGAHKAKGKGKGGGKLGLKGSGTGGLFKGSFFVCGQTGHRANERTERVANSVDEVGEDDAAVCSIDGVWMIAAVDSKEDREEGS